MKKLFSIGLLVILMALGACTADTEPNDSLQEDIEQLQQQVSSLQDVLGDKGDSIDAMQSEIDALHTEIGALQSEIDDLKSLYYDGSVVFSYEFDSSVKAQSVNYRVSDELSAFDLLSEAFDIEYTEFEWGNMLNAVGALDAPYGSFLHIAKNGTALDVGLSDATYEDGDHFHVERQWFDDTAHQLYDAITLFTDNQLDNYLDDEDGNLSVLSGLYLMHYEDFSLVLTDEDDLESVGEYQQGIIKRMVLGQSFEALQDDLAALDNPTHLYPASLNVFALQGHESFDNYASDFLDKVNNADFETMDHDSLVLAAFALELIDHEDARAYYDDIVAYVYDNPYDYYYGKNSVSLGLVMMLLSYEGIALDHEDLMQDNQTILEVFLSYQSDNGGFYYTADDETIDANFSTPQGFLALSYTYAVYSGEDVLPFVVIEQ